MLEQNWYTWKLSRTVILLQSKAEQGRSCVSPFTDFPECNTVNSSSVHSVHFLGSLSFSVRYDVVVKDSSSVEITGTGQSWCLLWAPFPPCLSYSLPKETHSFPLSARVFFHCLWVVSMGHICRESDNKTNRSNNLFCHSPVPQAAVWQCLLSST